ncbi:MAG: phosphotransferase, partial [Holosporales bacterium]|nr:phosphotransferase [Holosporales bacterium]
YHVDNLMILKGNGKETCGVLDFQDAGFGFQAYDVMSLLQDVRIEISDSFEAEMKSYYLNRQPKGFDRDGFEKSYTLLGLQRASKILGIFLRRIKRDQKIEMQTYLPRVWHEIEKGLASPLAKDLKLWWDEMFPKGRGK